MITLSAIGTLISSFASRMHDVKDHVVHAQVRWITETRKTQHALVELGSAALAASVALPKKVARISRLIV